MQYIEFIINPEVDIRAYLHQRWLLKIFIIINCILEFGVICLNVYNHPELLAIIDLHKKNQNNELVIFVAFAFVTIFNSASLLFGLYSISKHS